MKLWLKVKEAGIDFFVASVLLLFFFLTSIQVASLKPVVFFLQDIGGVYEGASLRKEVMEEVTRGTLSHIKGAEPDLPYTMRERSHLVEVRSLFLDVRKFWLISVGLAFMIFLLTHLEVLQWQERVRVITKGLTIVFLMLDLGLLFFFSRFFTIFHKTLFSPGTWEFSETDLLTILFPYQFWVGQTVFVLSFSAFLSAISSFILRWSLSSGRVDSVEDGTEPVVES